MVSSSLNGTMVTFSLTPNLANALISSEIFFCNAVANAWQKERIISLQKLVSPRNLTSNGEFF